MAGTTATTFLRLPRLLMLLLLLLLLCFSYKLVCLDAIPITRTRSLQHNFHGFQVSQQMNQVSVESWSRGRIDLELNDYPGSGANNRHSPRPQLGRGCFENC